jgi:hypothetical protein
MTARIAGRDGWVDPHNAGTYSVEGGSTEGKELHAKRITGNKKFTDLQLFQFSENGGTASEGCLMTGCSESQVTSYMDFSTNYCNLHDLYCGSEDGCKFVTSDLKYIEETTSCQYHDKGQCHPSKPPLEFLGQPKLGEQSCADCKARQKLGENISCPMCVLTI